MVLPRSVGTYPRGLPVRQAQGGQAQGQPLPAPDEAQQDQRPTPEQIRAQLRERLAARAEVDWAYLFGSVLDGPGFNDVDVGVYLRPALPREQVFDYEMELSARLTLDLHVAVDVHVLNGAPRGFQMSALRGEPLLVRDEEQLTDFIERVGLEVAEFAHHAERYLQEVVT